jgi:hypothetical protein
MAIFLDISIDILTDVRKSTEGENTEKHRQAMHMSIHKKDDTNQTSTLAKEQLTWNATNRKE